MKPNVPALVAACLVCVALGFVAGKASAPEVSANQSTERVAGGGGERRSPRPDRPRDGVEVLSSILNGRVVRDIPSGELLEILAKLSKYETDLDPVARAKRSYQLELLLAQLSAAQLEEIATAAVADKDTKGNMAIGRILTEFAGKDSDRALAWVAQQGNSSKFLGLAISAMAETDPDRASLLFHKGLMDGTIGGTTMWQASSGISRALSKLGALPLMDFVDTLPDRYRSSALYNATGSLPPGDELTLLDELYRRESGDKKGRGNLDQMFAQFVSKNPKDAEAWLKNMTDTEKKATLQSQAATRLVQNGDTDAAGEWMRRAFQSSPGKEKELFVTATRSMTYNNPDEIAKLAAFLPQGIELTAEDFSPARGFYMHSGVASLASVANAIPSPDEKVKFLTENLAQYSKSGNSGSRGDSTDFQILTRRIAEMNFSGENLERINQALESTAQGAGER